MVIQDKWRLVGSDEVLESDDFEEIDHKMIKK
jgi:hypothetical protein